MQYGTEEIKTYNAGKWKITLWILVAVFALTSFLASLWFSGYNYGKQSIRQEAVDMDVAVWRIDQKTREVKLFWKTEMGLKDSETEETKKSSKKVVEIESGDSLEIK